MTSLNTESIHLRHINNNFYYINENDQIETAASDQCENPLGTIERLFDLAKNADGSEKRTLESCAFDYLRWVETKGLANEDNRENFQRLLAKGLAGLLRPEASEETLEALKNEIADNTPWYQFIRNNRIHYAIHSQQLNFDPRLVGMVCVNGEWFHWSDFNLAKTNDGFTFSIEGQISFKTDSKYQLKEYCYCGKNGITQGTLQQANGLTGFFERPATGKYWLNVYVNMRDPLLVEYGKSRSYLGLEDTEGNFFYAGQFEKDKGFRLSDLYAPFGEKQMGIETPDHTSSLPLAHCHLKEARIEITQEQYKNLFESIKKDQERGVKGSILNSNCAGWVEKKLKMIGIQAKTTMTFQNFLLRLLLRIVPKPIGHKVVNWGKKQPKWVQKAALFNPIFYPAAIIASIVVSAFSGKLKSDFSILNAIFRPWEVKISHPIAVYDWLDTLKEEQEKYSILSASPKAGTNLGLAVKSATEILGFNVNEVGKLKEREIQHITQHKVLPLPLLILKAAYVAIKHKLKQWWEREETIQNNTMMLYLHTMMNQKFISPYQFHNLRESIDDKKEFQRQVIELVNSLHKRKLIDGRSLIHLNDQLKHGVINEPLQYLICVAMLNSVNHEVHFNAIQDLITPEIQSDINKHLRNYQNDYHFSVPAVKAIQAFVSRVGCYEWAQNIGNEQTKKMISDAIKARDEEGFSRSVRYYFAEQLEKEGLSLVEQKIINEMAHAVEHPKGESAFVNFSNLMQTQSRIQEVEHQLIQLKEQMIDIKDKITEDELDDLRQLHQNLGVFIDGHVGYTGSATFMSAMIGKLRAHWEGIDDLMGNQIMPSAHERDKWPDIGFREIKPVPAAASENEIPPDRSGRKKIFFGFCSWGGGHRSVTDALIKGLGDQYRMIACDIPDEILIERDPLFKALGPDYSIATLYNTLVAGNYWDAISLIMQMGSTPTPQEEIAMQKDLIRRKLLQERPDIVVATYEKHSDLLLEAAKELGIPFVQVYTDMVCEVAEHVKSAFNQEPDSPHQRILAPYPIDQMIEKLQQANLSESQYAFMGFPVRKEFQTVKREIKEEGFIAQLREKYGVGEGQKVVLCMNGGSGGDSPWPKLIADAEQGALSPLKLIVVCGKNGEFYEQVRSIQPIDPGIEIEARGYTYAQEMAEISAIADVTISKPGGATVAENLFMDNFLLLDTRSSASLQWEMDTAATLESHNLALQISSTDRFIEELKIALDAEVKPVEAFHQYDEKIEQTFIAEIEHMMDLAMQDQEMLRRRTEPFNLEKMYSFMDLYQPNRDNFEQNLANLLKLNERMNPEGVAPSLKAALWDAVNQGQFIKFNLEKSKFDLSRKLELKDLDYAIDVMIREMKNSDNVTAKNLEHLITLVNRAKKVDGISVKPLIKRLSALDFHRVSKTLRTRKDPPSDLEEIRKEFLINGSMRELLKWSELKTSRSRRKQDKYGDERLIDEQNLLRVYCHYPEELDFVSSLHLHRKASAFNHRLTVDDDHHLCILFEGEATPVSELIGKFHIVNGQILSTENDSEYTYTFNQGLSQIQEGQHPVHWKNEIPVFMKKERKSQDYRIEIMSVEGKENHSWLRLKNPDGHIYSVGMFWDPDYQLKGIRRFNSMPGYIRGAGDLQEFLGQEEHWKKTKIILNEEKFQELKNRIIQKQNQGLSYNLINGNCTTFMKDILDNLGVQYQISESPFIIYTMPKCVKKFLIKHQQIRTIVEIATYPLRLIQNFMLSILGMWSKKDVEERSKTGFYKTRHLFTWEKGIVDHPKQLRLLQEIMEEKWANAEGKIAFEQFAATSRAQFAAREVFV